jgi:hypothetical protein
MDENTRQTTDSPISHTEYVRSRFRCAGCGATLPAAKRAGGRLCVACRAAQTRD